MNSIELESKKFACKVTGYYIKCNIADDIEYYEV